MKHDEIICKTKDTYETEKIALEVANYYTKNEGIKSYPYKCPHCKKYHLTTNKNYVRF